jgi:hypothetical protein
MYGSDDAWVLHDYGVIIEANLCKDSRVGVVIEKGAAAVQRRNKFSAWTTRSFGPMRPK